MTLRFSRARAGVLGVLFVFATAFAPLMGDDQRNYLVILASMAVLPLLPSFRFRFWGDVTWVALGLGFPLVVTLQGDDDLSSFAYMALFVLAYLTLAGALRTGRVPCEAVVRLLERLILLFAGVSVLQMVASLAGLPVPNQILSKGLWSYNSLAAEPSHAGRALAMSMLCYLLLVRQGRQIRLSELVGRHRRLVAAFLLSAALTGSALAAVAAPMGLLLALGARWTLGVPGALLLIGPTTLLAIDYEPFQRFLSFLTALPTMDLTALLIADASGATRVAPLLLYLERASPYELGFWFGEGGPGAIARYFNLFVLGFGDVTAAGFIPGFLIAYGVVGAALFLVAFLLRFANRDTLPLVVLWVVLFPFSAWNTQLFWYGLMLVRVAHHYLRATAPVASRRPAGTLAPQPQTSEQLA